MYCTNTCINLYRSCTSTCINLYTSVQGSAFSFFFFKHMILCNRPAGPAFRTLVQIPVRILVQTPVQNAVNFLLGQTERASFSYACTIPLRMLVRMRVRMLVRMRVRMLVRMRVRILVRMRVRMLVRMRVRILVQTRTHANVQQSRNYSSSRWSGITQYRIHFVTGTGALELRPPAVRRDFACSLTIYQPKSSPFKTSQICQDFTH